MVETVASTLKNVVVWCGTSICTRCTAWPATIRYFYPTSWIIPAPFLGPDVHRLWSYTRPSPTNLRTDLSSLCITQALYDCLIPAARCSSPPNRCGRYREG